MQIGKVLVNCLKDVSRCRKLSYLSKARPIAMKVNHVKGMISPNHIDLKSASRYQSVYRNKVTKAIKTETPPALWSEQSEDQS